MCDIEGKQDSIDKERSRCNLHHEDIDMGFLIFAGGVVFCMYQL